MNLTKHAENLWQLTRLFAFNCFLVREDDGLTLIDTGLSGSGEGILKAAQSLGMPIVRVALTHAHGDHVGSLDEVSPQLPGVEVAMAPRTAEFLRGEGRLRSDEPQVELRGSFVERQTQPTRYLEPGDYVGSLRVVAAPGHTPDQIAFFDERDKTLIAGDAFQTAAGIAVAGVMRWLFPFPAMATWHLPTALETAVSLRALDPARMAVGHGAVLEQPVPAMTEAIRTAEAKVNGQAQTA